MQMRRRHTAIIGILQNWLTLPSSLLLPLQRCSDWKKFMPETQMTTRKSILAMAVQLRLVVWKDHRSKIVRYRHSLSERHEPDFSSSLNGLLNWLILDAHSGGPLFANPSVDLATSSLTMLHTHIASLEQQWQAGERRQ